MIAKAIAILALVFLFLYFAHTILTKAAPKQQEYEEYGDYFFNQ
jgi:hypothetical protein